MSPVPLAPSSVLYKLKDVELRGRKMRIVCHDLSSAYLPLLDVCNYFLLEKNYVLNLDDGVDSISRSDLVQQFIRTMNKEMDFGRDHPGAYEKPKDFDKFFFTLGGDPVDDFPDMFSRCLLGVSHIDPFNTKWTNDFAPTMHSTGFQFIKFPLHHGWIVDPEEKHIILAIGDTSSQKLRKYPHTLVKRFMENSTAELTTYGITCLDAELLEGQLAALYRKGRIDLIYKHGKVFYVLVTDNDRLKESPTAMWKSLSPVYQDEVYFTSNFVPLPVDDQPNTNGKKWVVDRARKDKKNDKNRLKRLQKQQQIAAISWVERVFRKFLEEYIYDDREVPGEMTVSFFEAQMEFMKRVRCFDFCVRYTDIEKFNRELATAIRSDKKRLTQLLTQVAIKFMITREFADERTIMEKANMIIHDVPEPLCC